MIGHNGYDPKEKTEENDKSLQEQQNDEGVFLVNDDGTDFDSSERTYVSVDNLDEETPSDNSAK